MNIYVDGKPVETHGDEGSATSSDELQVKDEDNLDLGPRTVSFYFIS